MSNETVKKLCSARDMDLISALPENLIKSILNEMSLVDAARTCILSRRWRYSWLKLSHLELDAAFWKQSFRIGNQVSADKFASILFHILLRHQGPISSVSLHIPQLESPPDIDTFINFIVRNGVQTCVLDTFNGVYFKLHSSLFTSSTLINLDIRSCEVNFLPTTLEKSSNLTSITLEDVTISAGTLKNLVSSCPSLRILRLKIPLDISCLEINAPKLVRFLYFHWNSPPSFLTKDNDQRRPAILKLLGGFPDLDDLSMEGKFIKSLCTSGVLSRLPTGMLNCLKSILLVKICFEDVDQFLSVLCLMRSSPKLQELELHQIRQTMNKNNNMENLREEEDYSDLTLNCLERVEMSYVVGGRLDLEFIRIVLAKATSLRKMSIGLAASKTSEKLKIIKEMFMFPRAAPNVKVHIDD